MPPFYDRNAIDDRLAAMELPTLEEIDAAADLIGPFVPPTPQYAWPLLAEALGTETWLKHENHTPTGAFKVRGGLVYLDGLARREPGVRGVVSATRGNHGQSIAFAARHHGFPSTIVVPQGNSREKNAAMRAFGATLIEHGEDFQASREHAIALAAREGLHMVPSFHRDLVCGVATGWAELFRAVPDLDLLLVPIGLGSGIVAAAAARRALGTTTRIVGVVSEHAPAYALSFASDQAISAPVSTRIADGMACRVPEADALALIRAEVDDVVQVDDDEVEAAMKLLFLATHNVAEGAGAASLAAAMRLRREQPSRIAGRRIGLTLCGGNVDHDVFAQILAKTRAT
jgi:threonine dehydratase